VAVAMCLPITGLPFGTAFPKTHWQSPASPKGPPAAQPPQSPILLDPLPTATGYYAETGTGRDSGKLLLPPPPLH
jgi:hypothetical protein